ncbi:uncharacterized protein LOC112084083 [Eutrema salsugineum]|uniref:uncharacterized protein LOC112084083 n=1 Tax=Eutrema salsugineum TaxID=72664 RepID=UPI000CED3533|nr:uncharacterized protein LOC112084083 [Eutrema salsugineum]
MAESMSLSPALDPRSPYHIDPDYQAEENLPMVILSQADDNYFIWKNHFLEFLVSKNKTGFVDGSVEKPDPSSPLYQPWVICNARVKCWLMNSVSENLQDYVRFAETAHKAWEEFRMIFVPSVDFKIYQLRQRIAMLRQDGDSVASYFGKLRRAWLELSEYDPLPEGAQEAREKEQRYAFLMGLNNDLSYVRTKVMLMNSPPSLDQAYALVAQAESTMNSTRC